MLVTHESFDGETMLHWGRTCNKYLKEFAEIFSEEKSCTTCTFCIYCTQMKRALKRNKNGRTPRGVSLPSDLAVFAAKRAPELDVTFSRYVCRLIAADRAGRVSVADLSRSPKEAA